ncbi:MAG: hypothetical protein F8N39_02180 [Clostridiaceae bacterium]|nr:hypothetical protein [Clostridiaceae bacterium]
MDKYNFSEIFEKRRFRNTVSVEYQYSDFSRVVIQVAVGFNLSLRDIEKLVVEVYMILKANMESYIFPYLLIMLCAIKKIDRSVYNKIKFKQISYEELVLKLKQQNENIQEWLENRETCVFKSYLIWLLNDTNEINRMKKNTQSLEQDKRWTDKDVRCLENYDWIANGKGYWTVWDDGIRIKENIFVMVELYDNFTVVNGE